MCGPKHPSWEYSGKVCSFPKSTSGPVNLCLQPPLFKSTAAHSPAWGSPGPRTDFLPAPPAALRRREERTPQGSGTPSRGSRVAHTLPGPAGPSPAEAGLRRPLPARRPEAGMLSGSGRPGLRGSAASSRCARPSASAPAPPTLVCSRPRPCGSAGARSRLQRGGGTESPAGEGCTRPAQSGALGAGCPGQVGAARGDREGAGPRQRTGARRDGRRVLAREGAAAAPAGRRRGRS